LKKEMAQLDGKVAIVTGSTTGMGRAVALLLARHGASVVVHGRDRGKGAGVVDEIVASGQRAVFLDGDIADRKVNESLVQSALDSFGRLDIVVANAGMLGLGSAVSVSDDIWHETFAVNTHAVFYLLRAAIPQLQKAGGGSIVVNSSIAAFKSFPNHPAYCASKAAVTALTKQIAAEYGPSIRANVICPGPVDTQFIRDSAIAFPDPAKAVQEAGERTPMKRLGVPEDVASLVLFLVSPASAWMTGSVITIDGGATLL
jgi:NAD(P)-dependent dehydrogenase (short-subunit alcohol dehydrogenase family)